MKEKVVERRTAVFEKTKEEVAKRVKFEDAVSVYVLFCGLISIGLIPKLDSQLKRPYFHVKPLEKIQLKTWKDYLDFEMSQGDQNRIIVLFERCMIACALYEELWSKVLIHLSSLHT